jgi:hypothetical protein
MATTLLITSNMWISTARKLWSLSTLSSRVLELVETLETELTGELETLEILTGALATTPVTLVMLREMLVTTLVAPAETLVSPEETLEMLATMETLATLVTLEETLEVTSGRVGTLEMPASRKTSAKKKIIRAYSKKK